MLDIKERLGIVMTEPGADGPSCLELSLLIDSLLSRVMIIAQDLKGRLEVQVTNGQGILSPSSLVLVRNGLKGRPSVFIDMDRVCTLKEMGFSWTDIAKLLGVSRTTLYHKCKNSGISFRKSSLSDMEIDNIVRNVKQSMPHAGERMIIGHFKDIGIYVARQRIRESIHRLDPLNTALRWNSKIQRRQYSVPGPYSLWHIGMIMLL